MAAELQQNREDASKKLRKQLALAVRSIQWSYAIFWSISTTQPGVLKWVDGYYNGDVKTRKTVQAVELNADQMGLQRSEQLRELYESLSAGESSRRPSAALSPEDLTDTEWYYLVCMSFIFNFGQGLPGRTLAQGQPIWICDAQFADSKSFTRSLLAKSASIQTVVCFPFMEGVVELGVIERVPEDPNLIQHIKASFLEIPYPTPKSNSFRGIATNDEDPICDELNHVILDTKLNSLVEFEEVKLISPDNNSNELCTHQELLDINGEASQVHSWQFIDDGNHGHNSINSSDCISQTFVNQDKVLCTQDDGKIKNNSPHFTSLDVGNEDTHYRSVLSSLLKSTHQFVLGPYFRNGDKGSSFVRWKKGKFGGFEKSKDENSQKLLKKVLFEVSRMHSGCLLASPKDYKKTEIWKPEVDGIGVTRKKENLKERFLVLQSLVPSIGKVDKVSILDDTIEYLKELEKRVEELESCRESEEAEATMRIKPQVTVERTSDNYCDNSQCNNVNRSSVNKRKAYDIGQMGPEINWVPFNDCSSGFISVNLTKREVVIEISCPFKEYLLLGIMGALSNLHIDSQSVQSFTVDGILSLTIKAEFNGRASLSAGMIKQALQKIINES